MNQKHKEAKSVLKAGAVYFADNGRTICDKCAGMSARFTGRDISGQKIERMTVDDVKWLIDEGIQPTCERGCTRLSVIAAPNGFPASVEKTSCCGATATYSDATLVCKSCFEAVDANLVNIERS